MRKINVLLAAVFCLSFVGLAQADTNGSSLRITGYKAGEVTISDETKESLSKVVKDLDKRLLSVKDQSKLSLSVEGAADNAGAKNSSLGRERAEGVVTVLKYLFPQAKISVKSSSGSLSPGEVAVWSQLEAAKVEAAAVAPAKTVATKNEPAKAEMTKAESVPTPIAKQQKRSNSEGLSWSLSQWVVSFLVIAGLAGLAIFLVKKSQKSFPAVHDDDEEEAEVVDLEEMAIGINVLDEVIEPAVMAPKAKEVEAVVKKEEAPALIANDVPEIIEVRVVDYVVKVEKLLHDGVAKLESPFTTLELGVKKMIPKTILFDATPEGMVKLEASLKKCLGSVQYSEQKAELLKAGTIKKIETVASVKPVKSLQVVGKKASGSAVAVQTAVG